jgi:hypothetical protein
MLHTTKGIYTWVHPIYENAPNQPRAPWSGWPNQPVHPTDWASMATATRRPPVRAIKATALHRAPLVWSTPLSKTTPLFLPHFFLSFHSSLPPPFPSLVRNPLCHCHLLRGWAAAIPSHPRRSVRPWHEDSGAFYIMPTTSSTHRFPASSALEDSAVFDISPPAVSSVLRSPTLAVVRLVTSTPHTWIRDLPHLAVVVRRPESSTHTIPP